MSDFSKSPRGIKYYERDLPAQIKALNRHAAALEEFNRNAVALGELNKASSVSTSDELTSIKNYEAEVVQIVNSESLCREDRKFFGDNPPGSLVCSVPVQATSEEEALDKVNDRVPLSIPEHFTVTVKELP